MAGPSRSSPTDSVKRTKKGVQVAAGDAGECVGRINIDIPSREKAECGAAAQSLRQKRPSTAELGSAGASCSGSGSTECSVQRPFLKVTDCAEQFK